MCWYIGKNTPWRWEHSRFDHVVDCSHSPLGSPFSTRITHKKIKKSAVIYVQPKSVNSLEGQYRLGQCHLDLVLSIVGSDPLLPNFCQAEGSASLWLSMHYYLIFPYADTINALLFNFSISCYNPFSSIAGNFGAIHF